VFVISTPATASISHSGAVLELDVGRVTGAQAARDTNTIIMKAMKKRRQ
jgi:hypothetical protein